MDKDEIGPERTCIVTRAKASPEAMIRFVIGPDGSVVPDIRRKLPGRGVWVTASRAVVAAAMKKKAFARGFKTKVDVDTGLDAMLDRLLAVDALQSLAMANKSGAVVTGFNKVEGAIAGGGLAALIHATDGSDDGTRKLDAAWRRQHAPDRAVPAIKEFPAAELDLALGRTNVIHAALAAGPASHAFLSRCNRLVAYRSVAGQDLEVDAAPATAANGIAGSDPGLSR